MRLVNESSRPTEEVRRLVRYGMKGLNTKCLIVTVKDGRKSSRGIARWYWDEVEIWIGPDSCFPMRGWRRHKNSPHNHDWQNWREALVALAAHEGKHIDRHNNGIPGNGKRGEMACEAHERWVLDRYRS